MIKKCTVKYPDAVIIKNGIKEFVKGREMDGYLHGPTVKNPQACVVEDSDGIVHVVNANIVDVRI